MPLSEPPVHHLTLTITSQSLLQGLHYTLHLQNFRLEILILPDSLSHISLELICSSACIIRPSLADLESLNHEMEVPGIFLEVSGSLNLKPTYVNHVQFLVQFHCLDTAIEGIKKHLVRFDNICMWD